MSELECIHCHQSNTVLVENIPAPVLLKLYKKKFKLDIVNELKGVDSIALRQCKNCDLRFYYPLLPGSDVFYEQLQNFGWYYVEDKYEYSIAAEYVKAGEKILDVGCGWGSFSKYVKHAQFTGLEYNQKAIAIGKQNGIKILNELSGQHALTHKEEYDVVTSFQVLEHVADVSGFLKECYTCVKPGGLLIISVPSEDSFISDLPNLVMNMPPHHISRWTDKAMYKIAEQLGGQVVSLVHDRDMNPILKFMYVSNIAYVALSKMLGGYKKKMLDLSFRYKVLEKIGKVFGLILKSGVTGNLMPAGHSVTIIIKKPL